MGDLIPGGGGLRKVRWSIPGKGKGKRGGVRIIYYWITAADKIILLNGYEKSKQGDLTPQQKRIFRGLAQRMLQ